MTSNEQLKLRIGKSPGRLIQDFDSFDKVEDPWNDPWTLLNQKHLWLLHLPDSGQSGDEDEECTDIWAICKKTRKHLHVRTFYSDEEFSHCRDVDRGSHVLYQSSESTTESGSNQSFIDSAESSMCWKCCNCSFTVRVEWLSPVMPGDLVQELVDSRRPSFASLLSRRNRSSSSSEEQKTPFKQPSLFSMFSSLEVFLRNILLKGDHRSISAASEGTFEKHVGKGDIVKRIMNQLLFTYVPEEEHYIPCNAGNALTSDQKSLLSLARNELALLAIQYRDKNTEYDKTSSWKLSFNYARGELINGLDVIPYPSVALAYSNIFQQNSSSLPDVPSFLALGVLNDVPDTLVRYFFFQQKQHDPDNATVYMDALYHIAKLRDSPLLENLIRSEEKNGLIPTAVWQEAYNIFGLDHEKLGDEEHDEVLLKKALRMMEKDPDNIRNLRKCLEALAYHRKSESLLSYLQSTERAFYDVKECYNWLGVSSDIDDSLLISVFVVKSEDDALKAREALQMIGEQRRSKAILEFIGVGGSDMADSVVEEPPMDINMAYEVLNVQDRNLSDELMINVYDFAVEDRPQDADLLRRALECIGESRDSTLIRHYLKEGNLNVPPPPVTLDVPVGLENNGNFCYLNSLLQFYFIIKPLRDAVLNIDQHKEDVDGYTETEKIVGGRKIAKWELRRALRFTQDLRDLFLTLITTRSNSILPSLELAYLALIPGNENEEIVKSISTTEDKEKPSMAETKIGTGKEEELVSVKSVSSLPDTNSLIDMDSVDGEDQKQNSVREVKDVVQESIKSSLDLGGQQDVTECIDHVLFQLSASMKPISIQEGDEKPICVDLMKKLFYGTLCQTLEDQREGRRSKEEPFSHLIIDLASDRQTLYEALDHLFELSDVEVGNAIAKKSLSVKQLPDILQIQIQRVQFNRVTGQPFKSNAYVEFGKTLFMDRYMSKDDPEHQRRYQRYWELNMELQSVLKDRQLLLETNSKLASSTDTLAAVAQWAQQQSVTELPLNPELPSLLQAEIDKIEAEIGALGQKQEAICKQQEELCKEMMSEEYHLLAVFIHRGQATFGHYWTYIYDFERDMYRKYNDEYVTTIDESEVFSDTTGNTANPYMLVYVKKECIGMIECLKRDPDYLLNA
ncbi:ubiquitin carboxy terminal hydrolase Ubp2 [Schizosaccharomyces japonicus yFS275]|uniref:ubiquitinyl hydrolase 1 n=1 Tax=Schizosaccharomyces japonicus (strain yFS275 / FY16936) TaxID=402676 RepID=B6JY69_SCHJY|nr:ubiquitin carboxy terminal hydrolase Ubp2 [Schizosaccharomyces japonicus yFS275]EEB06487.1 ubiquitin carboxy terminal hydrolase Ubp2 [Schizosaccharomyces japonicus yFS275]